ncbi:Metallo-dependent phosphatase [Agrocybe pediades]|nr:Metallo-dependent phosphatase [Agrocybe pediades]
MASKSSEYPEYGNVVFKSPTEVVHLEYTPWELPPKPSEDWTRFVCISDTHTRSFEVPPGDVLLHAGDLTNTGTLADFQQTVDWLCGLPHPVKIIIAGNHDLPLHKSWYEHHYSRWHSFRKQDTGSILNVLKGAQADHAGLVYLQDEDYEFQTKDGGRIWSVYGSPWSPEFLNWAFNYDRENGPLLVSKFPKCDILLTHGPAYQILDRLTGGEDVGCEALREKLRELRPRLHLAGHIHEAHGAYIHSWDPATNFEPPQIQNGDEKVLRSGEVDYDSMGDAGEKEHTVFVNGSAWPAGRRAARGGRGQNVFSGRAVFGGPGFQPVVVDLKD